MNNRSLDENCYEVIDFNNLPSLLSIHGLEQENELSMTSLNTLLLLSHSESKCSNNDGDNQNRLSLAYEKLRRMPKIILHEIAPQIKILDISHNEFDDLNFLSYFKQLETLICDHNNITCSSLIPYSPKLELLWLNYCKINELYPWVKRLQNSCPNLRHLSLMGNPAAPSYLNGGTFQEHLEYRFFVISLFPNLVYLDDEAVTNEQKEQAQQMYHRPLFERIVTKNSTNMPDCLRVITEKIMDVCSPVPPFAVPQKNSVI